MALRLDVHRADAGGYVAELSDLERSIVEVEGGRDFTRLDIGRVRVHCTRTTVVVRLDPDTDDERVIAREAIT